MSCHKASQRLELETTLQEPLEKGGVPWGQDSPGVPAVELPRRKRARSNTGGMCRGRGCGGTAGTQAPGSGIERAQSLCRCLGGASTPTLPGLHGPLRWGPPAPLCLLATGSRQAAWSALHLEGRLGKKGSRVPG